MFLQAKISARTERRKRTIGVFSGQVLERDVFFNHSHHARHVGVYSAIIEAIHTHPSPANLDL
jgi:hypothetical protein